MPHLSDSQHCTGCGACLNICQKNAIEMKKNPQGFMYPHIDMSECVGCLRCERICPKIHPEHTNTNKPDCYAARATDDIRRISSSGGVFSLLAQWILTNNGIVCGAAMDDDYSVRHICVENEDGIARLRKSKYVQSDMGFVYREILEYLKQGRTVLFSGCPCQVAAVKKYTKDYRDKIYLVDILCHGVPSVQMWKDYLSENFDLTKVETVDFRSKMNGWRSDQLRVFWKDGSSQAIPWPESAYEEGFQRNISLRPSCEVCEFSGQNRQGDLTIGDFWQVEKHDPDLNDKKGTSVVLVNNGIGQKMLDAIKQGLIDLQKTPIEAAKNNRFNVKFPRHPQADRFKTLYPGHTFTEAIMQCRHALYDIGLVGIYCVKNFGGHLTQYALYKVLTDLGYSVLMIECPKDSKNPPSPRGPYLFAQNPYPNYARSRVYPNIAEMKFLNRQCRTFVTGSDQMFNNNLYNNHNKFMSLNFVTDNHRKIAYAASWGHDRIWGEESDRGEESYFLRKFDYFSVREDSAVWLAKKEFGVDATWVLDPVFLCPIEEYNRLAEVGRKALPEHPYLFAYILDPDREKETILKQYAEIKKLSVRAVLDEDPENRIPNIDEFWSIDTIAHTKIEIWISHIANSEFVITDSFHGMCLAIIFRKEFLVLVNKRRGETRFTSLLHLLKLEERLCYSIAEVDAKLKYITRIDYKKVEQILAEEREKSIQWLVNAIETNKEKRKPLSEFDIVDARIDDLWKHSNQRDDELIAQINRQEAMIKDLQTRLKPQSQIKELKWLSRKLKGGVCCLRENGFIYTTNHFFKKVRNRIVRFMNN